EPGTLLTASNAVVGTPAFLSPEQADGKPATPASDVYGLGCTLHAALTGAPPFRGTGYDVLRRHLQEAPPDVRGAAPDVPERFAGLVLRCLAKDPKERGTPEEIAAALDAVAGVEVKSAGAASASPARVLAPLVLVALGALLVAGLAVGRGPGPAP